MTVSTVAVLPGPFVGEEYIVAFVVACSSPSSPLADAVPGNPPRVVVRHIRRVLALTTGPGGGVYARILDYHLRDTLDVPVGALEPTR